MGYLKDILVEKIDGVSVNRFFNTNMVENQAIFDFLKTEYSVDKLDDTIDKYKTDFSYFREEYDDCYCASESELKQFRERISKLSPSEILKFKFKASVTELEYCNIISKCAVILALIDEQLDKSNPSITEDIRRRFLELKTDLCDNSGKKIVCRTECGERSNKTLYDSIEYYLYPYFKCEPSEEPISITDLYEILFNSNKLFNKTFFITNDTCLYDAYDSKVPIEAFHEYGPCGDLVSFLSENIDKFDDIQIKDIFIKTIIIMNISVRVILDYLSEISEFAKDYLRYLHGDNVFTSNDFGIVDDEFYPESVRSYCPENSEDHVFTSAEADSIQANPMANPGPQTNGISIDKIDMSYKNKFLRFQKTINDIFKVKLNKFKANVNAKFFKRWYGRIPSMLSTYGGQAMIKENRMKGDPTQILLNSGVKYLQDMVGLTEDTFAEIVTTCKKVTSAGDINAKLNAVKNFCKQYKIEDEDPKTIKMQIMNEACFRIANAILQENGVYGYTADGIVENHKFPTCNHIVVSLFVENAQEGAEEQPVSNIFQKPESITVFAHPEKLGGIEGGYRRATSSIMSSFNPRLVSTVQKNMAANYKLFANNLTRRAAVGGPEGTDGENVGQTKKIAKAIDDGLVEALNIVIEQKKRCIQCVGAMFDMSARIMELAKRCVSALHEAEKQRADNKFNSGVNAGDLNRNTKAAKAHNMRNSGITKADLAKQQQAKRQELIDSGQLKAISYV